MLLRIGPVVSSVVLSTLVLVIKCHANYKYFRSCSSLRSWCGFGLIPVSHDIIFILVILPFLVFADVRGRSRGVRGHSRTFADVRGRSRTFADIRGHSRTFAGGVRGRSRTFAGSAHNSPNLASRPVFTSHHSNHTFLDNSSQCDRLSHLYGVLPSLRCGVASTAPGSTLSYVSHAIWHF